MIRFFELSINRKKMKKPVGYSLLQFLYFFAIVFGGLVPSASHSQTCPTVSKGDQVIVQNITFEKGLAVRELPGIEKKEVGRVHNNEIGTVLSKSVRDGIYTWYHVKWRGLGKTGWSAGIIDGTKHIAEVSEVHRKDEIVKVLFGGENPERIDPADTNHDYNDYGCTVPRWAGQCRGYDGGHSGWDVQTETVKWDDTADEDFYSLTAGVIRDLREGDFDTFSFIAIFDGQMTIFYLHAREISNDIKEAFNNRNIIEPRVEVGTYLGIQGNTGLGKDKDDTNTAEHLHIEVRKGDHKKSACGAIQSIDPIPCLYRWVTGARQEQFLPWDVDHNGKVDRRDRNTVRKKRGTNDLRYDVNCDGTVDQEDVDDVVDHIGDPAPAAPTNFIHNQIENIAIRAGKAYIGNTILSQEMIQELLDVARETDDGSLAFKHKIALLESLLVRMIPAKTELLANYPNPFNPETWIPYQLAQPAKVTVSIYATDGTLVRTLALGHQPAGIYENKSRAAYWDGRNEQGERMASGIYFYQLESDDMSSLRKMVILK